MPPTSLPPPGASRPPPTLGDLLYAEPLPAHAHETTWRALVDAVAAGDGRALLELHDRSHMAVFTLLVRMTCSRELAERLTAEVYESLHRAARRWPPGDTLVLSWMMRRARSLALARMRADRRKNRARHGGERAPFPFDMPDYRKILQMRSWEKSLRAALPALAPEPRQIVELVHLDGRTLRETADALGLPPGDVRAALRGAMCELARHLSPRADLRASTCPQAETTCALAVGALSADEIDEARAHLASCRACVLEAEVLHEVVEALVAWPTELVRPRDAVRSRLLEHVGAPPVLHRARRPTWRSVAPGISCSILAADKLTRWAGLLVRLDPGGVYPPHTHALGEELYLLSGELWIEDHEVHPGDYVQAGPGTRDHLVWSETGCSCVLITSAADVLGAS